MNIIEDRLTAAFEAKNTRVNNINSYVWKGPKEELNGQKFQDEIRLVDATDDQLISFYNHCMSMLYSEDSYNPGRYTLINIIRDNREKCNTELYLRYLEGSYLHDDKRAKYPRFMYLQDIKTYLGHNTDQFPPSSWHEVTVSEFTDGMPVEFQKLTVDNVLSGCLDTLGKVCKKPITLNFLTKMGVWFTPEEMRDLTELNPETNKMRDRLEVVKERLNLKPVTRLKVNPTGLSYNELRSMINLRSKKFSELTTDQLLTLRNKVLFRLEDLCVEQINFWEIKRRELSEVAESRGWAFSIEGE